MVVRHSLNSRPHSSQHSAAFGRTTGSPICFPFRLTPLCHTPQLVAGGGGGGGAYLGDTTPHTMSQHQQMMALTSNVATKKEEARILVSPEHLVHLVTALLTIQGRAMSIRTHKHCVAFGDSVNCWNRKISRAMPLRFQTCDRLQCFYPPPNSPSG